jgi:hypothetical protein
MFTARLMPIERPRWAPRPGAPDPVTQTVSEPNTDMIAG